MTWLELSIHRRCLYPYPLTICIGYSNGWYIWSIKRSLYCHIMPFISSYLCIYESEICQKSCIFYVVKMGAKKTPFLGSKNDHFWGQKMGPKMIIFRGQKTPFLGVKKQWILHWKGGVPGGGSGGSILGCRFTPPEFEGSGSENNVVKAGEQKTPPYAKSESVTLLH